MLIKVFILYFILKYFNYYDFGLSADDKLNFTAHKLNVTTSVGTFCNGKIKTISRVNTRKRLTLLIMQCP